MTIPITKQAQGFLVLGGWNGWTRLYPFHGLITYQLLAQSTQTKVCVCVRFSCNPLNLSTAKCGAQFSVLTQRFSFKKTNLTVLQYMRKISGLQKFVPESVSP